MKNANFYYLALGKNCGQRNKGYLTENDLSKHLLDWYLEDLDQEDATVMKNVRALQPRRKLFLNYAY